MRMLNKALLMRDLKYTKWFFLFMTLFVFISIGSQIVGFDPKTGTVLNLYLGYESNDDILVKYILFGIFITLMLLALVAFQFSFDRKRNTYSLAASMPFNRKEIINSKWFAGSYNILLTYVLVYTYMNVQLISNFCWQKYFLAITLWNLLFFSITMAVFGFMMTVFSFCGSHISGSIITALIGVMPFSALFLVNIVTDKYSYYFYTYQNFVNYVLKYKHYGLDYSGEKPFAISLGLFLNSVTGIICVIVLLLILTVIFYRVSITIFDRNLLERIGTLTTLKSFEKITLGVISYYVGLLMFLVVRVITYSIKINNRYWDVLRPDFIILFCIIVPIPTYFILKKVINKNNKRFA